MGALGYTLQRPEEDRMLVTRTELENRIAVMLGGIAAEDIVYQECSTGASNDLQRATDMARRMITEFGMSPKLGRVHYSEMKRSPFLSQGVQPAGEHVHSEETIREIDLEIKRLIDTGYATAHTVLSTRRPAMEHLTRDLLEKEVMDATQLRNVLDQYQTGPQLAPGTGVGVTPSEPSRDIPPPEISTVTG
jgi:cell division protease FtsH